jgi:hypothetical protein
VNKDEKEKEKKKKRVKQLEMKKMVKKRNKCLISIQLN